MAEPATGLNTPNKEHLQTAIAKIESCFDDLLSVRGEYMQHCKQIRESIKNVYDIADQQGIPRKELKTFITERDLDRKILQLRAKLEPDEKLTYDMLKGLLGVLADLPLGQAALDNIAHAQEDTLDQLQQPQ